MTPSQMLKPKVEPEPPAPSISVLSPADPAMLKAYHNQSEFLLERRCPVCQGDVTTSTDSLIGVAVFQCDLNVFHVWRRPQSFLTRD